MNLILYHRADLDGHCSGAVAGLKLAPCRFYGINYGDQVPWDMITGKDTVVMTDFCLQPFERMIKLRDACSVEGGELIWIDHHETALDAANDKQHGGHFLGLREIGKAGCELTWEYFFPDKAMPQAVHLLGRYDVWDHGDDISKSPVLDFQYGLRSEKDTRPDEMMPFWNELFYHEDICQHYLDKGEDLWAYQRGEDEKYARAAAFKTNLGGVPALAMNRMLMNSYAFRAVADPEKYHLMIGFGWRKGAWRISLWTERDDVHCGRIAEKFGNIDGGGGGGHQGAGGFAWRDGKLPFEMGK